MADRPDLIRDPKALRALAHPFRWRLIDLLSTEDSRTATQCAEALDESVASCSYHLNMLAKYGFVEEVPGPGRQKPWRMTAVEQSWSSDDAEPETVMAAEAATEAFVDNEFANIKERTRGLRHEPEEWRSQLGLRGYTQFLTPEEFAAVLAEVDAAIEKVAARRTNPELRPDGARPVRFFLATSVPPKTG